MFVYATKIRLLENLTSKIFYWRKYPNLRYVAYQDDYRNFNLTILFCSGWDDNRADLDVLSQCSGAAAYARPPCPHASDG